MSLVNNIINEFDIALKTLSNKKSGTGRAYPADSIQDNTENLSITNSIGTDQEIKSLNKHVKYKGKTKQPLCI